MNIKPFIKALSDYRWRIDDHACVYFENFQMLNLNFEKTLKIY